MNICKIQTSLIEKLDELEKKGQVELTKQEAEIYGISHSDILPDEDLLDDKEPEINL